MTSFYRWQIIRLMLLSKKLKQYKTTFNSYSVNVIFSTTNYLTNQSQQINPLSTWHLETVGLFLYRVCQQNTFVRREEWQNCDSSVHTGNGGCDSSASVYVMMKVLLDLNSDASLTVDVKMVFDSMLQIKKINLQIKIYSKNIIIGS